MICRTARTVILPAASYQDDSPAIGSAMPVIASGLFEGDGYTLFERNSSKIGSPLEPVFRIDRRTFIIPRAFSGEEYGDIVTKSVEETIVSEATAGDTGINIISSVVDPIGKGLAIKNTKAAKGGWPDPVEEEIVLDGTHQPPARYLRGLTRRTVTTKTGAVPGSISLAGDEVSKAYKRETPDRVDEKITTEELNLTLTAIDEDVQQKPFVKITSVMTPGTEKVTPVNRNGGSKLVYENGAKQIWENTEEIAEAREGPAGSSTDVKPYVKIVTDKRYSTDSVINTTSGGADIIFSDGTELIYEVSEITSTGRYGPAGVEQQVKPFVKIINTKEYSSDGILAEGQVGTSNKIYDDATTVVYDKTIETAEGIEGLKGIETNAQQWGAIKSTTNYTEDSEAPLGGSVQIVYKGSNLTMYEATTTEATISGGTVDIDSQPWGHVKWVGSYAEAFAGVRSRQVWSNGVTRVFLNEDPVLTINGTTKEKDNNQWGEVVWDGEYASIPGGDKFRQVANIGGQPVYLNETATVNFGGVTKEIDPQQWGSITWEGAFAAESGGVRSQKVTQIGTTSIYKNENPTLNINGAPFVSAQETHPLYTTVETSSYASEAVLGAADSRSKQIFALGAERVFENIERSVQSTGTRTYGTMVKFTAPSVCSNLNWYLLYRRRGGADVIWNPIIEEGFEGYIPAEVVEYYSDDPAFTPPTVVSFGPAPIKVSTPFGNVAIGPTLHGVLTIYWELYGDPTYFDSGGPVQIGIPQTNYTHWRGAGRILVGYETQPYLKGFIVREIYVTL